MIRDQYDNPPVYVFENGYPDYGELEDYDRINYFYQYVSEMLTAINDDGCNVVGYAIWSLLDNFEWCDGYTWVDFSSFCFGHWTRNEYDFYAFYSQATLRDHQRRLRQCEQNENSKAFHYLVARSSSYTWTSTNSYCQWYTSVRYSSDVHSTNRLIESQYKQPNSSCKVLLLIKCTKIVTNFKWIVTDIGSVPHFKS